MTLYSDAIPRAKEYARRRNLSIEEQLGGGIQGVVFSTNERTAIKAFIRIEHYQRERDIYLRLTENHVEVIQNFWIPKLVGHHDELWIVEMQIVSAPYVLDFASAYIDEAPPYANDPDILLAWEQEKREQFGGNWPVVQRIISDFRQYGIYLADVKPGNITFAEDDP